MQHYIPGTTIPYGEGDSAFEAFRPLIRATDGLTLSQVCGITGIGASAIQNWVKRKFVSRPEGKKYRERQLARILLICALRDCMKLDKIGALMSLVNGDADDTGDDIISEEQMFDYLCAVIAATEGKALSFGEISELVDRITKDYVPAREGASKRLKDALSVMVLAYIAGEYKKEADRQLDIMEEKI